MANRTTVKAVKHAAKLLGGQASLARALGIYPVNVANWITSDPDRQRPVPAAKCVAIEQLTEGAVGRKQLRPNDYAEIWPELAKEDA